MLAPNGIFRVVVPDLEKAARTYISAIDRGQAQSNAAFMMALSLGKVESRAGVYQRVTELLGNSNHLWMWDTLSLSEALLTNGFQIRS